MAVVLAGGEIKPDDAIESSCRPNRGGNWRRFELDFSLSGFREQDDTEKLLPCRLVAQGLYSAPMNILGPPTFLGIETS